MKWIFEESPSNKSYYKLWNVDRALYYDDSMAKILDIEEKIIQEIAIECGGVKGYKINLKLCYDDHFYFKTFEQCLNFEKAMEPYIVMAELIK